MIDTTFYRRNGKVERQRGSSQTTTFEKGSVRQEIEYREHHKREIAFEPCEAQVAERLAVEQEADNRQQQTVLFAHERQEVE
jgi:hypothetical protein